MGMAQYAQHTAGQEGAALCVGAYSRGANARRWRSVAVVPLGRRVA